VTPCCTQVEIVAPSKCKYSLWDWPAAQRACLPAYDENMTKRQKLPLFQAQPDSHLAAAEAAAREAFALMQNARPQKAKA
jgi:hypothetical protein